MILRPASPDPALALIASIADAPHLGTSYTPMLLVIGGSGFIGRHLSVRAHHCGIPVTIVTPVPDAAFIARHSPSAQIMSLVDFLAADGDRLLLRATALVYLASRSVSISNVESPVRELRDNVIPAFEAFLRVGRVRPELPVIFISSGGAVYGRTEHNRTPESEPVKPISPYGLGKVLTEKCLIFCSDTVGQPYAILRASNAIGRWHRNRHQGLAMAALRAIRSGAPLDIYGDGNAVRDYIDADDLADAILAVAASGKSVKGIWNVGSGVGHSTLEVVETVASVAGRWPRVVFKPSRSVDVPRSVLDPTRFAQDFGWEMRVTFRNAIERLVQSAEAAW